MISIEIDEHVMAILKRNAEPFSDTPNDVLRKLLGIGLETNNSAAFGQFGKPDCSQSPYQAGASSEEFVAKVMSECFGQGFSRIRPYQYMFESKSAVVYFQNFNKRASKLWFRIDAKAWTLLTEEDRATTIILSNPAERYAYLIPIKDINQRAEQVGWQRDHLEINIDHPSSRWTELDWNISSYLAEIPN